MVEGDGRKPAHVSDQPRRLGGQDPRGQKMAAPRCAPDSRRDLYQEHLPSSLSIAILFTTLGLSCSRYQ